MRSFVLVAALSIAGGLVGPAAAQDRITRSDFNVDPVTGPVLASGRIVGLGGAYTALATGIDGAPWNPASYGSRVLWEVDWFEYDLSVGVLLPGRFSNNDFFNNGRGRGLGVEEFLFLDMGIRLQFGRFGVGGLVHNQSYVVREGGRTTDVSLLMGHYGAAWMFLDGQLVVGFGARTASLQLIEGNTELVDFIGTGPEAGALLRVEGQPWRLGVAARTPVQSTALPKSGVVQSDGVSVASGMVLPQGVYLPWEFQVGVAFQLGRRPLNRKWKPPQDREAELRSRLALRACVRERKQLAIELARRGETLTPADECPGLPRRPVDVEFWRKEHALRNSEAAELEAALDDIRAGDELKRDRAYEQLPRQHWLLSMDALFVGPSPSAVGIDAFIDQERRRAGASTTVGLRFGMETEPWLHRLKVRGGSYLEPSRNSGVPPRLHGTFGLDFRMFRWDLFGLVKPFTTRISVTSDVAPRYWDFGIGFGNWH